MRRDERLLGESALLHAEAGALLPVIDDPGGRVVGMVEAGPVGLAGGSVRTVDLRTVDLLEGLHRADRGDELQIGVVLGEVAQEVEGQRGGAARRHEVPDPHSHLPEVLIGQRVFVLLVFDAEDGVAVLGPVVGPAAGDADADDRRLAEVLRVGLGLQEALEEVSVQHPEVLGEAGVRVVLGVLAQPDAEVVVPHVGGEVVAHDALGPLPETSVNDAGMQHLDQGEGLQAAVAFEIDVHRDDVELDRATAALLIAGQRVEAIVDHLQGPAQILPPALTPGEIGEVGGQAGVAQRLVVLVEPGLLDGERQICHLDSTSRTV